MKNKIWSSALDRYLTDEDIYGKPNERKPFLYDRTPMRMTKGHLQERELFIHDFFLTWNNENSTDDCHFHSFAISDSFMQHARPVHIELKIKSKTYIWEFENSHAGLVDCYREAMSYIKHIDEILKDEKKENEEGVQK